MQGEVVTTSGKPQMANGALTATFYPLKWHFINVQSAEAVEHNHMKYNLQRYIQTVFHQVKESIKTYQLNIEGDMSSLGTSLTKDIRSMCARITKCVDRVRGDVSDSCKGLSLK